VPLSGYAEGGCSTRSTGVIMSTKSSSNIFATIFHVACGLGAVFVICGLLNLWACLVVGVVIAVVGLVFLLGAAWLFDAAKATAERLSDRGEP
jgi:hypothetical protein